VSIEIRTTPVEQARGLGKFKQVGTGFFVSPDDKAPFRAILITAKHVLQRTCPISTTVYLRFKKSPKDENGEPKRAELQICQQAIVDNKVVHTGMWVAHPSADLVGIFPPTRNVPDLVVFSKDEMATREQINEWNVFESDDIFTISFHPNLVAGKPSSPIVRSGIIAEFSEEQENFIVDAVIFPGNSGSPVLLKPTGIRLGDSGLEIGRVNPSLLLGVVVEYIPYIDIAISQQTNRPRVSFEENSGLTRAVRSECVRELLEIISSTMPPRP
jgi:hypothetical protein